MRHTVIRLAVVLAVIAGLALPASAGADEDPGGRDIARMGTLHTVEGILRSVDDEWALESETTLYELHMGRAGHEAELPFRDGAHAVVRGFVHKEHIAPIVVETGGTASRFWTEDRYPVWAGSGQRRNAVAPLAP